MTAPEELRTTIAPNAIESPSSQDMSNLATPPDLDFFQFDTAAEEFYSYEVLKEKYSALEGSFNASMKDVATLQERNRHFLKVLKYVDKGMGVKLRELEQLKKDNQYLKACFAP
jgi:hypothetical protein